MRPTLGTVIPSDGAALWAHVCTAMCARCLRARPLTATLVMGRNGPACPLKGDGRRRLRGRHGHEDAVTSHAAVTRGVPVRPVPQLSLLHSWLCLGFTQPARALPADFLTASSSHQEGEGGTGWALGLCAARQNASAVSPEGQPVPAAPAPHGHAVLSPWVPPSRPSPCISRTLCRVPVVCGLRGRAGRAQPHVRGRAPWAHGSHTALTPPGIPALASTRSHLPGVELSWEVRPEGLDPRSSNFHVSWRELLVSEGDLRACCPCSWCSSWACGGCGIRFSF